MGLQSSVTIKNWENGKHPNVLKSIHERDCNIAIYNRNVLSMQEELRIMLESNVEFRSEGSINSVSSAVSNAEVLLDFPLVRADINLLLGLFKDLTQAENFRLALITVDSNMCRKFHADINDLRLLCTYKGPGTMWLTEDNLDREAMGHPDDNVGMVIDTTRIMQAEEGDVLVLKGALYEKEGTRPIVHRSPTIEESGGKRILLRLDTDEFANF